MRKTFLRTESMHEAYVAAPKDPNFFVTAPTVIDFEYWRIIRNGYPYDAIATRHDMLIPKRQVPQLNVLTDAEQDELEEIIGDKIHIYDMVMLNLPHQQSQPHWLHYHLVTLKLYSMHITIKKLTEDAKVPNYAHGTDAGMDLYYSGPDTVLAPGARGTFTTGIAMAIPRLYAGLIWDKSGMATKQGLKVLGGVVDAGYRGEVLVGLLNTSETEVTLQKGQKLAQMLIQPVTTPTIEVAEELPEAEDDRGEGGFGSTGDGLDITSDGVGTQV